MEILKISKVNDGKAQLMEMLSNLLEIDNVNVLQVGESKLAVYAENEKGESQWYEVNVVAKNAKDKLVKGNVMYAYDAFAEQQEYLAKIASAGKKKLAKEEKLAKIVDAKAKAGIVKKVEVIEEVEEVEE